MLLSLQLYTVRRAARMNLQRTLQRVAQAGYGAVEVARVPLTPGTLHALQSARQMHNLVAHSFQLKYPQLSDTAHTIPFLQKAGCRVAVVSVLPSPVMHAGEASLVQFCNQLNALGSVYAHAGITLAYHHHNFEAVRFGEKRGFTVLEEALDPAAVKLVCDTYWLQKSGYCPQEFIASRSGAIAGVHLRDYTVYRTALLPRTADCPLGEGMLNFKAILTEAQKAGASYCAVEQNSKHPFDDIKKSITHLEKSRFVFSNL